MRNALIIFVRNPVLGKVKTRLAHTMGETKALEIYVQLLMHTHAIMQSLEYDKYVFYTDEIAEVDIWENDAYHKVLQEGADLGERMKHAFEFVFAKGYLSACIIGSDCMMLSSTNIESACIALGENDMVIGPSVDGGYYLLGMNKLIEPVFINKSWSTETLMRETISTILSLNLSYHLLPFLNDIDTEQDWLNYQNHLPNL